MKISTSPRFTHHSKNGLRRRFRSPACAAALCAVALLATAHFGKAASGTWTQTTSGGLWSDITNWNSGSGPIADGLDSTADFSTIDITADDTVHLDSVRTIGNLIFGDTDTSTPANWILDD